MEFGNIAKFLITIGFIFIIIGVIFYLLEHFGANFLGKLPGDIFIKKGNVTIYIPIVTSIILSILLTIILNIIFRK